MLTLDDLFDNHVFPMVKKLLDPEARLSGWNDVRPVVLWFPSEGKANVRMPDGTVHRVIVTVAKQNRQMTIFINLGSDNATSEEE